ncbi:alpha,alpha-trehalase ath1 [Orbilia oligospora]|uniref:alpha,alpha-trehalase n=1 Tax=Orbilia oligospora TaxID=2813651 RepID=A0A6G1MG93_ORBOL|nr:alpha,alpha-trehalase ath1 [Orbilia oligospora]KAF3255783.1 alpha,alpha-trehalase ath1 [Orbilia oligospora]
MKTLARFSLVSALLGTSTAFPWAKLAKDPFHALERRQVENPPPSENVWSDEPLETPHWDNKTFTLYTNQLVQNAYQHTPYVANGYIGQRFGAEGHGFQQDFNDTDNDGPTQPVNGWPLDNRRVTFGTVSGFWNSQPNTTRTNFPELAAQGGESVIAGLPSWVTMYLITPLGDTYGPGTKNSTISNFMQSMSLRNGIIKTSLTWSPAGGCTYDLTYTVMANRFRANVGYIQLDVVASHDVEVSFLDLLDGRGALRTWPAGTGMEMGAENIIWSAVHPHGLPDITAYVYSTVKFSGTASGRASGENIKWVPKDVSSISQVFKSRLTAGKKFSVFKSVGIASSEAFPESTDKVARTAALAASDAGYDQLLSEHNDSWDDLWEDGSILAEYDEELQISLQATLFHLLCAVRSGKGPKRLGSDASISVGGLTSDSYAGFVFWDADLWMYPGLVTIWPEYALPIINLRSRLLAQSERNAREYGYGEDTAVYSWTTGRFGNCTGTGPCVDYQYHLNTDIAFAAWEYFLNTGDMDFLQNEGWPIIRKVANFFTEYVTFINGSYHTTNLTDPDEYANHVDDGAFTNASIKKLFSVALDLAKMVGFSAPSSWTSIAQKMFIPYDAEAGIIPEFTGMNGSVTIKQVDVALISYPLGFKFNDTQARNDLFFYAKAQSPDGPAMTWSVYSIVSAELIDTGCQSWTHALQGSQTYLRAPWYQFSEQVDDNVRTNGGTNPAFPFLTGHGGYLQVWTHGYTGFRSMQDVFYLEPSLPPHLSGGILYKTIKWQGASFEVYIGQQNTTIKRVVSRNSYLEYKGAVPVRIGDKNAKAGTYHLFLNEVLTIPTRLPHKSPPFQPGNLAQCVPVTSNGTWAPSHFPLAAVDGSNATTWQPVTKAPSSITIDLAAAFPPAPNNAQISSDRRKIREVILTWGAVVPYSWLLEISNDTNTWERVWGQENVAISIEWDPKRYIEPQIEDGNSTSVVFDREYEGRFARLTIAGNQANPKAKFGATVAEVALIGA